MTAPDPEKIVARHAVAELSGCTDAELDALETAGALVARPPR